MQKVASMHLYFHFGGRSDPAVIPAALIRNPPTRISAKPGRRIAPTHKTL
jgi:hypothetical protein